MKVGYCRVSSDDQSFDLQRDALKAAGCERIFEDRMSGGIDERPGLQEALTFVRNGDHLLVWRLDRLGRSLPHLVKTVGDLQAAGVAFSSLQESLDTGSAGGKLVFHIFSALAEFERDLIRSRTRAGLEAARARGRVGGRPEKLSPEKILTAKDLLKRLSADEVCRMFSVSRSTLYRHLKNENQP